MLEAVVGSSTIHSATFPDRDTPAGGLMPIVVVNPLVRLLNSAVPCVFPNGAQTVQEISSPTATGKLATTTLPSENHSVQAKKLVDTNLPPVTTHCEPVPACRTSFV